MRKAQIALEFMSFVIIGLIFALILFVGFIVVMNDTRKDQSSAEAKDFGFKLQREIILASEVHEGYIRKIFIPEYLGKAEFTITNNNRILIITSDDIDYPFRIPETNGTLQKGNNTIRNVGGLVVIE